MDKRFQEFILNDTANVSLARFAFNLVVAALLSQILAWLYRRNAKTLSNRGAFASNFLLLTMTTTLIITVVKTSLALSLGLVGALSIVRFRAAIKEPEELNFLFICIATGLGLGANQLLITLAAFGLLCTAILLRKRWEGPGDGRAGNLHLRFPADVNPPVNTLSDTLKAHCRQLTLSRLDDSQQGTEASFSVTIDSPAELEAIRASLAKDFPGMEISYLEDTPVFDEN